MVAFKIMEQQTHNVNLYELVILNALLEVIRNGSRAGLDPRPAGSGPNGGGNGSDFPPWVCRFGDLKLRGAGSGFSFPPRVTYGPPKFTCSPTK
jgi:hypothetical protein